MRSIVPRAGVVRGTARPAGDVPAKRSSEKHAACFSRSAATLAGILRVAAGADSPSDGDEPDDPDRPASPASGANAMSHHWWPAANPVRHAAPCPTCRRVLRASAQARRQAACCFGVRSRPSRARRRASRRSTSPTRGWRTADGVLCRARIPAWSIAGRMPATETSEPARSALLR